MNRKRLTQGQLVRLGTKLMMGIGEGHYHSDGCEAVMVGKIRGKEVALFWEVVDRVQQMTKIITEQGHLVFTVED